MALKEGYYITSKKRLAHQTISLVFLDDDESRIDSTLARDTRANVFRLTQEHGDEQSRGQSALATLAKNLLTQATTNKYGGLLACKLARCSRAITANGIQTSLEFGPWSSFPARWKVAGGGGCKDCAVRV